jgi:hypothetical protein
MGTKWGQDGDRMVFQCRRTLHILFLVERNSLKELLWKESQALGQVSGTVGVRKLIWPILV